MKRILNFGFAVVLIIGLTAIVNYADAPLPPISELLPEPPIQEGGSGDYSSQKMINIKGVEASPIHFMHTPPCSQFMP